MNVCASLCFGLCHQTWIKVTKNWHSFPSRYYFERFVLWENWDIIFGRPSFDLCVASWSLSLPKFSRIPPKLYKEEKLWDIQCGAKIEDGCWFSTTRTRIEAWRNSDVFRSTTTDDGETSFRSAFSSRSISTLNSYQSALSYLSSGTSATGGYVTANSEVSSICSDDDARYVHPQAPTHR